MVHCDPTKETITAAQLADLFLHTIFRLYGLPLDIVSDRGALFTSHFWKSLPQQLDIHFNLSTAFHPQSDGQTERVNQILGQFLRTLTNYDDWERLLPLAELTYNNT